MTFNIKLQGDKIEGNTIIPFEVLLKAYNDKLDKWLENSLGKWYKIIKIESDLENKIATISIESWDTLEFTPAHSYAYSSMSILNAQLKNQYNGIINKK